MKIYRWILYAHAIELHVFVQAQVCEWLGEAYEDMAAHGVASFESEPDQDAGAALHDSALTDHSMQTDTNECKVVESKIGSQSNGKVCACK